MGGNTSGWDFVGGNFQREKFTRGSLIGGDFPGGSFPRVGDFFFFDIMSLISYKSFFIGVKFVTTYKRKVLQERRKYR